jgi:hypothetical protein
VTTVVNGIPKSGTHAMMAWLYRMGLKRVPGTILACGEDQELHVTGAMALTIDALRLAPDNVFILAHVNACHRLDGFRVVTVFRDPRNVLVSYCRHRMREEGLDIPISQAIEDFWGAPFVSLYSGFLNWRGRSIVVRYEDLPAGMIGDGRGMYSEAPRDWNTRTGSPSNWLEWWDSKAEETWSRHGGPDLLVRAGYA